MKFTGVSKKWKESQTKFTVDFPVNKETKIIFYNNDNGKTLFYLWFHTKFIKNNKMTFGLADLDKPNRKEYTFQPGCNVVLRFKPLETDTSKPSGTDSLKPPNITLGSRDRSRPVSTIMGNMRTTPGIIPEIQEQITSNSTTTNPEMHNSED